LKPAGYSADEESTKDATATQFSDRKSHKPSLPRPTFYRQRGRLSFSIENIPPAGVEVTSETSRRTQCGGVTQSIGLRKSHNSRLL